MALLLDLFGYLSVVLDGLALAAQAVAVGGAAYFCLLAWPLGPRLEGGGVAVSRPALRLLAWAGLGVALAAGLRLAVQLSALVGAADIPLSTALGAGFVSAWSVQIAAGLIMTATALRYREPLFFPPGLRAVFALCAAAIIAGSIATSHAMARMEDSALLAAATALHEIGASVWIGGLPFFLAALARLGSAGSVALVARRYSIISMASVAALVGAALVLAIFYIGDIGALWGTAYGVMTLIKVALFLSLICLGACNYRLVERLRRDPGTSILRLRRFVEIELGIGMTVFFAAASLTSVPPGIDLTQDRVTLAEISARFWPPEPRLASPDHDSLAIPQLEARLEREPSQAGQAPAAFVPGAGILPPRNAADIAWSEYNHNWAGVLLLALGTLALLERLGLRAGRHWPLLFVVLAIFLVIRSDPEVWPLGEIGFFESLRDAEVLQHRAAALMIAIFGIFEWAVRTKRLHSPRAALVFPAICALGGVLLLTHSHAVSNVREALLIEYSHSGMALFGIAAGWARWLELRMPGTVQARRAAWIWPLCFIGVGAFLLDYRETSGDVATALAPVTVSASSQEKP